MGFIQADVFFFIASVSFVVLGGLVAVLLYYLITIAHDVSTFTRSLRESGETIRDWLRFASSKEHRRKGKVEK